MGTFHQSAASLHRPLPQAGERLLDDPQVRFDEFSETELLVEFAHQDQATVGSDAGPLEIDFERGVERELKWLILFLAY